MISSQPWGAADGQPVELYTLSNGRGMTVRVATYGAAVQSVLVPDRFGEPRNVALGFSAVDAYAGNVTGTDGSASGATYFGAIVGRFANRIAGRSFALDGQRFDLVGNSGPDDVLTMHGGPRGYSAQVWEAAAGDGAGGVASAPRRSGGHEWVSGHGSQRGRVRGDARITPCGSISGRWRMPRRS